MGHLIKQAKIAVKDTPDGQQRHRDDSGAEERQGDIPDALEFASAVQRGGFHQGRIDPQNGRDVQDTAVAHALPGIDKDKNEGPVFGRVIPGNGGQPQRFQDTVHETGAGVQKAAHDVGNNDDGHYEREKDAALRYFFERFVAHLRDQDGQSHPQHHIYQDEADVVAQGVAQHGGQAFVFKQKAKIFQSGPLAAPDAVGGLILLKCQNQPAHGQKVVDGQIGKSGQHHQVQGQIAADVGLVSEFFHTGLPFFDALK